MTEPNPRARVVHRFRASPERVFDAWLDPTKIALWFGPGLGEMTRIEVDARVGGRFSFVQRRGGQDVDHVGEYLELDRPKRLAFTWGIAPDPPESRVTIEIAPHGSGCELVLVHEMHAKWVDYVARTERGWSTMLEAMAPLLG
jgi:uncharacterized protein YndB with AHSA1/START domain